MKSPFTIFDRISDASMTRVTETRIVCGDCAGDEILPRKTNLTTDGRCAECGGLSYIPASVIGVALGKTLRIKNTETITNYVTGKHTKTHTQPGAAEEPRQAEARIRLVASGS